MRAAQISGYGGQEVVQVTDAAPKPSAGAGQVLVAVRAAGVNPFDLKVRDGLTQSMGQLNFPATLGGDVAGVVAELGEGVGGLSVGQEVYGQANALSGQGSFAEFTPVKVESLAAKPASTDWPTAAALPLVSCSAYQALVDHMQLQAGQKILVHGGAGGIGSLAIQLAKHLGAEVTTTVVAADADFVRELGANEVIDYTTQDFAALLHDYDAVFDPVGGETNAKSYAVLKPGGVLVSMVAPINEQLATEKQITYVQQSSRVTTERLQQITELVDAGILRAHIDKVFPLAEAASALEYLKTGHPRGKVVLQIA